MTIHSSLVDPVLQSASVAKISTITSCIVKSATILQWTVNQSYYLLEHEKLPAICVSGYPRVRCFTSFHVRAGEARG